MRHSARVHKYNAKAVTIDGVKFPSMREGRRYSELKLLERAGEIEGLCVQVTYPLKVNEQIITRYRADFTYRKDGKLVVEDSKGFKTDVYKIKAKMFKAQYGFEILET